MAKIDKECKIDHIDDEAMAAFIDHRLSKNERKDVMEHLSECDDCRKIVMNASLMKHEDIFKLKQKKKLFIRYLVPLALAASLVLVIVPVVDNIQDGKTNMSKGSIIVDDKEDDESWLYRVKEWIDKLWENITGEDDE